MGTINYANEEEESKQVEQTKESETISSEDVGTLTIETEVERLENEE